MKILKCLLLCMLMVTVLGNYANNRLEWMEQATHSSSVSSSIDRPPASPGPQNDVTAGALVAPDLKSSANIRPIYKFNLEPLTRFINHYPLHRDSRESVFNPVLKYYLFGVDGKESGVTAHEWSASKFQDTPANLQEPPQGNKFNSFESIIHGMVTERKEREYLNVLAQIIKYMSPGYERPDGFPIQGTGVILNSHPSFWDNLFDDKYERLSKLMRLFENLLHFEINGEEDESKSKQRNNFYKEHRQTKIPINPPDMFLEGKVSLSDSINNFLDSFSTKYLSQLPQHWPTDRSTITPICEIMHREYTSMSPKSKVVPTIKAEERVQKSMYNIYNIKESANTLSEAPYVATSRENSIKSNKNPISTANEIKDQLTEKHLSQETEKNQIPYYISGNVAEVISDLCKLKELIGNELKNLYSNEKKHFSKLNERVPLKKAILMRENRIIRDYFPFDPNNISNLSGIESLLKLNPQQRFASGENDRPKKMSHESESNLELNIPDRNYLNGYHETKELMTSPIKTNLIKEQISWEPSQNPSSIPSLQLIEIPLHYLKETEELLDILKNQKAKVRTYPIPNKNDYSQELNMFINQDTMKLPPGFKEIIEGGAGKSPGKHEGGGFKLKINIPP